MASELEILIGRLNPICRRALELAAGLCVSRTNYNVELEHVLAALLELPAIDLPAILKHFEVDPPGLTDEINRAIEEFDRGNSRTPSFSPQVLRLLRESWVHATIHLRSGSIRSGALILAMLEDEALRGRILESGPSLAGVRRDELRERLEHIIKSSVEATGVAAEAVETVVEPVRGRTARKIREVSTLPASEQPAARSETPALDRFTLDLIAEAEAGRIDPVTERDREIRQVIDVLVRRRQNNPILVGDAGVGKTAIVEGLALRASAGDLPEALAGISLRTLDLALLEAGSAVKGEFERRLKSVIAEVEGSPRPVILFVDEAHSLIGAGGREGRGDAANLLKPALAAGRLRTIAATTWAEYKRHFEKDPALARRFQPVRIDEPDSGAAVAMLRGLVPALEEHHQVRILDEAVREAVRLSRRYLPERRLPASAVSVLDTACARAALAQGGKPPVLEDLERRIHRIDLEAEILERETLDRSNGRGELDELAVERVRLEAELEELRRRWRAERDLADEIVEVQKAWDQRLAASDDGNGSSDLAARYERLKGSFAELQGDRPLVPVAVDARVVAEVIAGWTGIPVGRMLGDEVEQLLGLQERLAGRIIGQPEALEIICRRVRTARAGLEDPRKPRGVFLLVGPSGVGKTETASALAEQLYGGERNLIRLNMTEFQEAHSVATLKGAPPGYVGYGEGGVLAEAVRRRPYSVVLLDEFEKAHRDVVELFYQVFDRGILEDGEGVPVDFRNTVVLLTSSFGGRAVLEACSELAARPRSEQLVERLLPILTERFPQGLVGRMEIVPYYPLGGEEIQRIVELKLRSVQERIRRNHLAELVFDSRLVDVLTTRCLESDSGARRIDALFNESLLPELSSRILERMVHGRAFARIRITVDEDGRFV